MRTAPALARCFENFTICGCNMRKISLVFCTALFCLFFSGLFAWSSMQRHSVPLPDDSPGNNEVAAPEQKPQPAPATAARPGAESGAAAPSPADDAWSQTTKVSGLKVDFRGVPSLKDVVIKHGPLPVSLNQIVSSEMVEGQQAVFQFRFTDPAGTPLTGLRVASWLDPATDGKLAAQETCNKKIQSFLQMQFSARPEVDLNTYYVLALTTEPSILIIDPRVGFSTSKLYAVIDLAAPGQDWVQSRNGDRLFVTMPAVNQVAAIDSLNFRLMLNVSVGAKPGRILVQPDGKYVWVALDSTRPAESGVVAIDAQSLDVAARIPTGRGHHEIVFDEKHNLYVTNQDDGTVSVIDLQKLVKLNDVPVGKAPVSLAYSSRSKNVYVASQRDGKVTAISTETRAARLTMDATPGLTAIRITPDGRWGFVANGTEGAVLMFDTASDKFVQSYEAGSSPDQITFSDSYAYVRSRGSEDVRMIRLDEPGSSTAHFVAGQNPPGELGDILAAPMATALDGSSAFVANPADKRIYFYQEGMAAPMSSMEGYGKSPTAVMVLDRSIHETEPGIYSVGLRLPKPGVYDVPVFVDSPAVAHCFEFTVKVNPFLKKQNALAVELRPLKNYVQVKPGEPAQVQFRLVDPETEKPKEGIRDVEVTVLLADGLRQLHFSADHKGEGVYQFTFAPPKEGVYYAMVRIPSLRIRPNQLPYLMVRAVRQEAAAEPPEQNNQQTSK